MKNKIRIISLTVIGLSIPIIAYAVGVDRVVRSKYEDKKTIFRGNDAGTEITSGEIDWANGGAWSLGSPTGIGNTAPLDRLHIGPINFQSQVFGNGNFNGLGDGPYVGLNAYHVGAGVWDTVDSAWDGAIMHMLPTAADASSVFSIGFVDQATGAESSTMTISKDGNVGIGTASPAPHSLNILRAADAGMNVYSNVSGNSYLSLVNTSRNWRIRNNGTGFQIQNFGASVDGINITATGVVEAPNGIKGHSSGVAIPVGQVGEIVAQYHVSGSTAFSGTGVTDVVNSISLTAGVWLVTGSVAMLNSSATPFASSIFSACINTVANTCASLSEGHNAKTVIWEDGVNDLSANGRENITLPNVYFNISGTTTIYQNANMQFAAGSAQHRSSLWAVRIR